MAKTIESLKEIELKAKQAADEALAATKVALGSKNIDEYKKSKKVLDEKVRDWNIVRDKLLYTELLSAENPMIEAVQRFYKMDKKVKEETSKDDDTITDVKFDYKKARIDLRAFCEYASLDLSWAEDSAKLLDLLSLREIDVFTMSPAELAKKSYYFISKANKKMEGETPDSNTQIVRLLQQIIDEAIFVDDGNGKNVYKCTSHDIAFIQDSATKMDTKEKCTITMMKPRFFESVMMGVFAHCLGEKYSVKVNKPKKN